MGNTANVFRNVARSFAFLSLLALTMLALENVPALDTLCANIGRVLQARFFARQILWKRGRQMKRLGVLLILGSCMFPLSASAIREAGPCYGFGCPAFASKGAPPAAAAASASTDPAPAEKKHHHKFRILHPF